MKNKIHLLFLFLLFAAGGCQQDDEPGISYSNLVEAELFRSRTASELQSFIEIGGVNIDFSELKYDVDIYKVTYKTPYKSTEIIASGLIILPVTTEPVSMISFQHGTIAAHADAPSASTPQSTSLILYAAMASAGFITVVPDFIGFGASKDLLHPYYVKDVTASAVVDNLKAAHQLAAQEVLNFTGDLFLAGYSQGGYATMATHQYLEENEVAGFDLIASFPAAGGYDVKGMQEYFFDLEVYHEPFYLAYVAAAYKEYYEWEQDFSEIFKDPYAEKIPSLFDGQNGGRAINDALTDTVSHLVHEHLLANIDTDPAYAYIADAFNENSLTDWTPTIPVYMFHGTADITVPYKNSVDTFDQLIDNGASRSVLTLTPLEEKTHATGVVPYIEEFVPLLLELR